VSSSAPFFRAHELALVFAAVFAGQAGLPVPAEPVLIAAGALAGAGRTTLALALVLAVLAAVAGDSLWYEIGRRRGRGVLRFLCRISLEPDTCVRRTDDLFARHGGRTLVAAKFVPGLTNAAPALAGIFGMPFLRFLALDAAAAAIWAGSFVALGYAFRDQMERLLGAAARFGASFAALAAGLFAAYLAGKFVARWRFLHSLRMARISPEELRAKLEGGEDPFVVDLRHEQDFALSPELIPGALRLDAEELERRHDAIPREREIVVYCT
jgi:membrane protein DedA with SNARE-associated domain